ncbi:MAG: diacylglycerol kinase family protein [Pseudomonadota bacterium]
MEKVLFLINPVSGTSPGEVLARRIRAAADGLLDPETYDLAFTEPDTVTQAVRLARRYGTIIAVGGDGTLGQVVQATMNLSPKPCLGVIPFGVGNDLARSLGVYKLLKTEGLRGVMEMVLRGRTRNVDVMQVNNQILCASYFGAGNDARISNLFNRFRPRATRPTAQMRPLINNTLYGILILGNLLYTIPFPLYVTYRDKKGVDRRFVVPKGNHGLLITNSSIYAGGAMVSSMSDMTDGKFEVTLIANLRQWFTMHFTRVFRRPMNVLNPKILQFQTERLIVEQRGQTFYQIDGEKPLNAITGTRVLEFSIAGQAPMLVP